MRKNYNQDREKIEGKKELILEKREEGQSMISIANELEVKEWMLADNIFTWKHGMIRAEYYKARRENKKTEPKEEKNNPLIKKYRTFSREAWNQIEENTRINKELKLVK
jgi:hypothetical protein